MSGFIKDKLHLVILGFLFILLVTLSALSSGYFGGADNITHYLISHYAFRYPSLFLDAWGRPLYTILSAPFSQFGLYGAKIFNIILGLLTAWYAFRTAKLLELKPAFMSIVFVCFTPLYFMMMPTALTEILFSFVLVLAVFEFTRGRYLISALVISFLPFARTEGFILLPAFLLALIWVKQYKPIPCLAAGVVFFSLLGGFYYKDFLWVLTRFPYPVTHHHAIYHTNGDPFHFLGSLDVTLGWPLGILFIAGIIGNTWEAFSVDGITRHRARLFTILVIGPFILYFTLHSLLFWKALGGSLGLDRVMAAVMPMAALVAMKGYQAISGFAGHNQKIRGALMAVAIGLVIFMPFRLNVIPFPLPVEEETIREATTWLKASPEANSLLFYTDNNVPYYLHRDPWNKAPANCYLFGDARFLDTIPAGSVVFWDAHFGPNESKIPLDSLLLNPRQQLLSYFQPVTPWITFGGYKYECYITKTLAPGQSADNLAIRDSLTDIIVAKQCADTLFYRSFELPGDAWDPSFLSRETAHNGKQSFIMDGRTEYSSGLCIPVAGLHHGRPDSLLQDTVKPGIRVVVYVNLPEAGNTSNTLLVVSFEHKNKPYSYTALNLNEQKIKSGHWRRVSLSVSLPVFRSPDDLLKVYIWNPGKQVFYIDDMRVERLK